MASTPLGDIVGARFSIGPISIAAVASNGATGRLLPSIGPYPHPLRVTQAWFTPTAGNGATGTTATYRYLALRNGGTAGTGTTLIGQLNLTASWASMRPQAFGTVTASATVAAGEVMWLEQGTVGGNDSAASVLTAGQANFAFEVI